MPVTIESVRFGTVEVPQEEVIEFPFGLIGLGGSRYTLLDRNPGTGFLWLHAVTIRRSHFRSSTPTCSSRPSRWSSPPRTGSRLAWRISCERPGVCDGAATPDPSRHHRQSARPTGGHQMPARLPARRRLPGDQRGPRGSTACPPVRVPHRTAGSRCRRPRIAAGVMLGRRLCSDRFIIAPMLILARRPGERVVIGDEVLDHRDGESVAIPFAWGSRRPPGVSHLPRGDLARGRGREPGLRRGGGGRPACRADQHDARRDSQRLAGRAAPKTSQPATWQVLPSMVA